MMPATAAAARVGAMPLGHRRVALLALLLIGTAACGGNRSLRPTATAAGASTPTVGGNRSLPPTEAASPFNAPAISSSEPTPSTSSSSALSTSTPAAPALKYIGTFVESGNDPAAGSDGTVSLETKVFVSEPFPTTSAQPPASFFGACDATRSAKTAAIEYIRGSLTISYTGGSDPATVEMDGGVEPQAGDSGDILALSYGVPRGLAWAIQEPDGAWSGCTGLASSRTPFADNKDFTPWSYAMKPNTTLTVPFWIARTQPFISDDGPNLDPSTIDRELAMTMYADDPDWGDAHLVASGEAFTCEGQPYTSSDGTPATCTPV